MWNTSITTERLTLVPISQEYAAEIFKEFTDEITLYMFPKTPETIDDTLAFIHSAMEKNEKGEELQVTVLLKETGEFLGGAGIHAIKTQTPGIGVWIKKSAHGHAYGREAVTGLKDWLDNHVSYAYIKYPVDKKNIASRKIAESLGGKIGREMQKTNQAGRVLDEVEYWIYKNEKI